jgi:hypothetical protein
VVESESGKCYCWKGDAEYVWSNDAGGEKVYDLSKCSVERIGGSDSSDDDGSSNSSGRGDARTGDEYCKTGITRQGKTLKPGGDGRGWSKKYDDLGTCLEKCTEDDGYEFVVESESGSCYCWEGDADYVWSTDAGGDIVYDLSKCSANRIGGTDSSDDKDSSSSNVSDGIQLTCPPNDEPGWLDQPSNMGCKKHGPGKFVMEKGYEFFDWDNEWKEFDGTMRECSRICQGLVHGEFSGSIPASCWVFEFRQEDGDCILYGSCEELERRQGSQVSVYCGLT